MSDKVRPLGNASFELGEASVHLEDLLREVSTCWVGEGGEEGVCDISFGLSLGHIIEHLNRAWHGRSKSPEQVQAESSDAFAVQAATIPRWTPNLRMLTAADAQMEGGAASPDALRRWYLPWTWWTKGEGNPVLTAELEKARFALLDLRAGLDAARLVEPALADGLAKVLGHLNLAWHWRRHSAAQVASLEASVREVLASSVPWNAGTWDMRLEVPKPPAGA